MDFWKEELSPGPMFPVSDLTPVLVKRKKKSKKEMSIFSFLSVSERTVSALGNSRFECCVCGTVINKVCLFNLFTGMSGTFHSSKIGEAFRFLFVWFNASCKNCLRKKRAISWRFLEAGAALNIYKSKCMPLCLQLLFMGAERAHKASQSPASLLCRDSRCGHCQHKMGTAASTSCLTLLTKRKWCWWCWFAYCFQIMQSSTQPSLSLFN